VTKSEAIFLTYR